MIVGHAFDGQAQATPGDGRFHHPREFDGIAQGPPRGGRAAGKGWIAIEDIVGKPYATAHIAAPAPDGTCASDLGRVGGQLPRPSRGCRSIKRRDAGPARR